MKKLISFVVAAAVALPVSVMAQVKEDVLTKYAKPSQFLDIKISPEGNYLAATSRTDEGKVRLTVLDINDKKVLSMTEGQGNESVASFNWANDDRLVMSMAREVGSLDAPIPTGEIFAMDADGGNQKILTGPRSDDGDYRFAQIIDFLPDEPNQVMIYSVRMMSNEPYIDLYRMKLDSGRKRAEGRIPLRRYKSTNVSVLLDDEGVSRIAVGTDPDNRNQLVMMTRDGANEEWEVANKYFEEEGHFTPMEIMPDGHTVIGTSTRSSDTSAIVSYDLNTHESTVIAEHPKTDIAPIFSLKNGRNNELIGGAYEYDAIDAVFFQGVKDKQFANITQSIIRAFPNRSVGIRSATLDNSKMVITVSSANHPAEFYLYDAEKGSLSIITQARPWLDKQAMPETQIITYQARDGLKIHGLLTLPPGKEAKDLPLILLPHGGPHGIRDSLTNLDTDAKVLAEHGYAVLQPNFRGSGGYGNEFLTKGYKKWGTTMIDDMTDGVDYLIEKGIADPERMCVYGASYGGYAALMSVIREPKKYKCTIGFVGVYDLNLMFQEGDISEAKAGVNYLSKVLPTDKAERASQSPVHQVDKLEVPVFIIQGGRDVRVPKEHAFRLRDALEKRNHTYEWLLKPGEGHGFYKPENNIERWNKMLVFLDKYINE